ncbi:hypothetical protein CWR41_00150 [Cedecea lapagei]|jgi:hypothetical protein|uniref:hypothetical protein n=1 Tax=Enterobacter wuhouensis TaxID=2529381 RepID=UPI000C2ABB45|nr:hypothetical protein CWR41_00150 [Cedecea lapagei]
MTTATLGDLFPEMRCAAPTPVTPRKTSSRPDRKKGTAATLKELYPEIESWHPVFATQAWFHWRRENNLALSEPVSRDERFMDYLAALIQKAMVESGQWQ